MGRKSIATLLLPPLVIFSAITVYHLLWIPSPNPVYATIRASGILAYAFSFLAIVASAFPREITRLTGDPFIRAHHIFAAGGLVLMAIHGLSVLLFFRTLSVFVPDLGSLRDFLMFGGRVALPLFILTAATARFSRSVPFWRKIHILNYAAFFLVTAHALMIGTDFDSTSMRALAYALSAAGVSVPVIRFLRKPHGSR